MVDLRAEGKTILDVEYLLHLIYDFRPVLDQLLAKYLHLCIVRHLNPCLRVCILHGTDQRRCLVDSRFLLHVGFEEAELGRSLLMVQLLSYGLA